MLLYLMKMIEGRNQMQDSLTMRPLGLCLVVNGVATQRLNRGQKAYRSQN
jgi:hypothetical protein